MCTTEEDIGYLKAGNAESLRVEAQLAEDMREIRAKVQRLEFVVGAATALAGFIAAQAIGLWQKWLGIPQ